MDRRSDRKPTPMGAQACGKMLREAGVDTAASDPALFNELNTVHTAVHLAVLN